MNNYGRTAREDRLEGTTAETPKFNRFQVALFLLLAGIGVSIGLAGWAVITALNLIAVPFNRILKTDWRI